MREIIHHWWVLALRSVLALVLAAAFFLLQAWVKFSFLDAVTVPFLIVTLSAYGILDSLLLLFLGLQFTPHSAARTISFTQGICGGAIGVLMVTVFFRPAEVEWFLYIITAQAAVTGTFEILTGLRFTSHVRDEWACFATGVASIGFAVLLQTTYAGSTRRALDWFLAYALLLSASMGWFSFRLLVLHRQHRHHLAQEQSGAATAKP